MKRRGSGEEKQKRKRRERRGGKEERERERRGGRERKREGEEGRKEKGEKGRKERRRGRGAHLRVFCTSSPATTAMVVGREAAHTPSRFSVFSSIPDATTSGGAH